VEEWGRVFYTENSLYMNLHSGSREERNWEPENSEFRKKPFFLAAKIKIENHAVVGTFPGQKLHLSAGPIFNPWKYMLTHMLNFFRNQAIHVCAW